MKEEKNGFDISALLEEATEENERARAKQELRAAEENPLTKTIVAPPVGGEETKEFPEVKVRRNLDAETIELIDQYSTREIPDRRSDTLELKNTLARKLQGDKLLGYIENQPGGASRKADNLRTIIRESGQISAEEMEKRMAGAAERFSDEADLPAKESYEQAEMFPLGDGLTLKEKEKPTRFASYDKDYEDLGSRVVEHGFESDEDRDEGQIAFIPDETDVEPVVAEMDETEINLRLAFDMMQEDEAEKEIRRKKSSSEKKTAKQKAEIPVLRYNDRSQNAEIDGKLRKAQRNAFFRVIAAAILLVVLWRFETSGTEGMLGFLLKEGSLGVRLYLLIDLQLLFLCGLAVLPSLVRGVRGLFSAKPVPESVLAFGFLFAALYVAVTAAAFPGADSLRLYGLPMAVTALCAAVSEMQTAARNRHAFRMIATKRPKYIAERLQNAVKESEEFGRYLYEDSELYTVCRTDFVEGFSERSVKRPKYDDLYRFLLPLLFTLACGLFVTMVVLGKEISEAFNAFVALVAFALPSSAFFVINLPLTAANRKGRKCSGAFIGNCIAEEYSMASALSFADTEVYPASLVNVTSVKTYGDYRIDKVIPDVAKVFSFLGGPLAKVTERMMDGNVEKPLTARVIENAKDGICVAIDGRHIFLGKRSYLRRYRFEAPVDQGDDGYEKGVGSVMYVVIDEQLAAKFYVRYRINPRFEQLLQDMYRAGLCLGVKTMDPNITNEMIHGAIKFRRCPVAVLKQDSPDEIAGETASTSGGVVCNSSLHNFLRMFSLCDKVRHVTKCNAIIMTVATVLSALAVGFLAITGDLGSFGAVQAAIFQLCWLIPVWVLSFLSV